MTVVQLVHHNFLPAQGAELNRILTRSHNIASWPTFGLQMYYRLGYDMCLKKLGNLT